MSAGAIEGLFDRFDVTLRNTGSLSRSDQILAVTRVAARLLSKVEHEIFVLFKLQSEINQRLSEPFKYDLCRTALSCDEQYVLEEGRYCGAKKCLQIEQIARAMMGAEQIGQVCPCYKTTPLKAQNG